VQALILAGGEGTRLRPLTESVPKPVIPLVGRPFIGYMIEWLRGHGVDDVVMACGFLADGVRAVLGDGESLGVRLRYIEEPHPLGTGGALKFAQELLADRFLMLNGDVLTDIDISALIAQHERTGAVATLALYPVEDPSAYGLVRRASDLSVTEFLEKPTPDQIDTNLINAGAYMLERTVLDTMPAAGTKVSIEREVFPGLVGNGLYGYATSGYWLDIGTPERYLQATFDILEGTVATAVRPRVDASGLEGEVVAPVVIEPECSIASGANVGPRAVLGRGVTVGHDARVARSVLLDGAEIGPETVVENAIVGPQAIIAAGTVLPPGSVLGAGTRIVPGDVVPEEAIKR
jgi:mannose-1-phosphate guanylyltransferase